MRSTVDDVLFAHTVVGLNKILVGDKFLMKTHGEFEGKTVEIVDIKNASHGTSYTVKVNGELYPMTFNETMFDHSCVLIR